MSLILSDELLEESVATLTADSVIGRLFYEIERISQPESPDENWLSQMLDVIRFSQDIETGFGHAKAFALAVIKLHWEDVPFDIRRKYGFDFMSFARTITGKERSTILNYIATAKTWFLDKKKPEGTVQIKVRDTTGKPIINEATNEARTKTVEFNPCNVDMSKLLLVNAPANQGKMTPHLWEMLVDPFYTCEEIRSVLNHSESVENTFYFFVEGPGLFVRDGAQVFCISEELNWVEYDTDPNTKRAMDKFFSILRVDPQRDEDTAYQMAKENYM